MCRTHKYKNTNTAYDKVQEDLTCSIFQKKRGLFKDFKNYIPMCRTHKYKNTNTEYTNTQIQHMTKCQKDPTCIIFLKRGFSELSMYHLCIVSASSKHHQRIISASSAYHQCIISASPVHRQCLIIASSVHHQCIISTSSAYHHIHWNIDKSIKHTNFQD